MESKPDASVKRWLLTLPSMKLAFRRSQNCTQELFPPEDVIFVEDVFLAACESWAKSLFFCTMNFPVFLTITCSFDFCVTITLLQQWSDKP